jgi:hypothetical protein
MNDGLVRTFNEAGVHFLRDTIDPSPGGSYGNRSVKINGIRQIRTLDLLTTEK